MAEDSGIAAFGSLIADPVRASMLWALVDGRALPASELAARAGTSRSNASGHLARLVDSQLVSVARSGRHRYYRLAEPGVASALEAAAVVAQQPPPRSLREHDRRESIRFARSCYDHLAGTVAVAIAESLERQGAIVRDDDSYEITPAGHGLFLDLGVDLASATGRRRALARSCLDWSERRYHLAGAVGAALLSSTLDHGWFDRLPATRALRLTDTGRTTLNDLLGLTF
jgi:DNA-binding transcriptional ArsR family regulator